MFHPTPREAQMIEAIAEATRDTLSGFGVFDPVRFAHALRSLARGGGEKLECTCNIQYISCDVHEKPQITFSPAQVEAIEKLMPRFFNTHLGPKGQFQETKKLYEYLDSHTESET
jgi:hypothetical protein